MRWASNEIDPVLVSPFRSHPLSFQILHEGRLHLEAANGEIGSLYPLLLVKRLDGCCLHKVHQGRVTNQFGEDNRHGQLRPDTELREDQVPDLPLSRHVLISFYPFLFKDLLVILRQGGRSAESSRQQRNEEYRYSLYVHFSTPADEAMIHTSLSLSFLKASG